MAVVDAGGCVDEVVGDVADVLFVHGVPGVSGTDFEEEFGYTSNVVEIG